MFLLTSATLAITSETDQGIIAHAAALTKAGKVGEAETLLRSASSQNPDSTALHGALGGVLFKERKYEECIPELNIAAGEDPDSREYTMSLAEALIGTQRFPVAVDFLTRSQARFGNDVQLHYDLGLAYYFMNKIGEAQEQFEQSLRISPTFDRAQLLIAGCLIAQGNALQAADLLRELVKKHPNNAVYWGTLGRTLAPMGEQNKVEAVHACRRALALQPNDPHLQFDAGTVLTQIGNLIEARAILEKLEKNHPEILAVHSQLARIYSRLGQKQLARNEVTIVAKLQQKGESEAPAGLPGAFDQSAGPQ